MSLKYRRSVLFDQPEQTTAKLQMQSIIRDCKQKLNLNSCSSSRIVSYTPEKLTITQAKYIETLHSKLRTVSFHTLYNSFQKHSSKSRMEPTPAINPEKVALFRQGKVYRCSNRAYRKENNPETFKKDLLEYFYRKPEEEEDKLKQTIVHDQKNKETLPSNKTIKVRRSTTAGRT